MVHFIVDTVDNDFVLDKVTDFTRRRHRGHGGNGNGILLEQDFDGYIRSYLTKRITIILQVDRLIADIGSVKDESILRHKGNSYIFIVVFYRIDIYNAVRPYICALEFSRTVNDLNIYIVGLYLLRLVYALAFGIKHYQWEVILIICPLCSVPVYRVSCLFRFLALSVSQRMIVAELGNIFSALYCYRKHPMTVAPLYISNCIGSFFQLVIFVAMVSLVRYALNLNNAVIAKNTGNVSRRIGYDALDVEDGVDIVARVMVLPFAVVEVQGDRPSAVVGGVLSVFLRVCFEILLRLNGEAVLPAAILAGGQSAFVIAARYEPAIHVFMGRLL